MPSSNIRFSIKFQFYVFDIFKHFVQMLNKSSADVYRTESDKQPTYKLLVMSYIMTMPVFHSNLKGLASPHVMLSF